MTLLLIGHFHFVGRSYPHSKFSLLSFGEGTTVRTCTSYSGARCWGRICCRRPPCTAPHYTGHAAVVPSPKLFCHQTEEICPCWESLGPLTAETRHCHTSQGRCTSWAHTPPHPPSTPRTFGCLSVAMLRSRLDRQEVGRDERVWYVMCALVE